jgi:hypothetical protein
MALLIGYLKRGDESDERDWVEAELWRAVSIAVASRDSDDEAEDSDELPRVDGLSEGGRLPENANDKVVARHLFPERECEDYAAKDAKQVTRWHGS